MAGNGRPRSPARGAVRFHGHHHDRPDYSASFLELGFQAHAVGFRGITALAGDGGVSVIRPGDYDADGCVRWEDGDE